MYNFHPTTKDMGFLGIIKFFLKSLLYISILGTIIVFIPNLPPFAEIKKPIKLAKFRDLTGPLALNEKLKDMKIWHQGDLSGPEGFADYNGELYTGLNGGNIVKLVGDRIELVTKTGKPCKGHYEEHICGRPLGMVFDKNGNMIVADAYYGILRINVKTGNKEILVSPNVEIEGKKPKLFNSVALASNGDIYWTDSSTQFELNDIVYDFLSDPSGRLIHYDAKTKKNKVLIDQLMFANGVLLLNDEEIVVVGESFGNRLKRYYLKGPKKGTHDIFIEGLPGFVDNLKSDGKGGLLLSLIESYDAEHPSINYILYPFPRLRRFIVRTLGIIEYMMITLNRYFPSEIAQKAIYHIGSYGMIKGALSFPRTSLVRISNTGEILESYHTSSKNVSIFSEAHIFKDKIYFGSPLNNYIGVLPLKSLGFEEQQAKHKTDTKEVPQQATTPKPTQAPTAKPTQPPIQKPTQASTAKPTQSSTQKPTQVPAAKPTQVPAAKPTQAPTAKPTQVPTAKPTTGSTPKPTQAPTQKSTSAPSVKSAQVPTRVPTKPTQASAEKPSPAPTPKPVQTSTAKSKPAKQESPGQ
ncbi:adipocyte plasma membrane-associated protein Hemomucin-like isoform X1 [Diorhabda carinulata]|uniref:adipocyte plasma membrane-associated protein Hemomucin-like isoform X1 n=2 Tax=Diorhabda carinulata TaxID=1163345 RepID=UPI0025A131B7|nr:adipocyte plasma membrane-associated protein Hemomucin-like isoform X1 [Diorhabda carinulata]